MGLESEATVYSAEVYGVIMALLLIATHHQYSKAIIFTDNQAAICLIHSPGGQSGQYLLARAAYAFDLTRNRGIEVEIHWILPYTGVLGNKRADWAAKEVTGWTLTRRGRWTVEADTPHTATKAYGYILVATCSQALNRKLQEEWITGWQAETQGSALRKIQQKPLPQVLQLHKAPRPVSSLIVQMRTGKIELCQFLFH